MLQGEDDSMNVSYGNALRERNYSSGRNNATSSSTRVTNKTTNKSFDSMGGGSSEWIPQAAIRAI